MSIRERALVLPSAVVLVLRSGDLLQTRLIVLDPATGAQRWQRTVTTDVDSLVFADAMLIEAGPTGAQGLDWVTGETRWSVPAVAAKAVGLGQAADGDRVSWSWLGEPTFGGSRFMR